MIDSILTDHPALHEPVIRHRISAAHLTTLQQLDSTVEEAIDALSNNA